MRKELSQIKEGSLNALKNMWNLLPYAQPGGAILFWEEREKKPKQENQGDTITEPKKLSNGEIV